MPISNQIDDYTNAGYHLIISDPEKIGVTRKCCHCEQEKNVLFEVVKCGELFCIECLESICQVTVL